jgi:hypothetical protein
MIKPYEIYWIGLRKDGKRMVVVCHHKPTVDEFGREFNAFIGPMTCKAARWARKQCCNPHFQTTADAERICRE